MFGFLIGSEVNDDAVALKKLTDMALNKYASLTHDQLAEVISRDFDEKHRFFSVHFALTGIYANFVFPELIEFQFSVSDPGFGEKLNGLSVSGRGKYLGFMLYVSKNGSDWRCSVSNGIAYRATGGARKLVKVMSNKYGITDISGLTGISQFM